MTLYYSTPDNKIKIYNDDYLEVKLDEKADLIVTSPPYNVDINYENYIVRLITTKEQHEVLKKLGITIQLLPRVSPRSNKVSEFVIRVRPKKR